MSDFPKLARIKVDDENMEKIHVAARKGQTVEVRRLIEMGIDPAIPNRFGCTPLHLACKFGQVETAKYLAGVCDVQTSWHGQKPLHLAVLANKLDLVAALVAGAQERGKPLDSMLNDCDENTVTQIGSHFKECKGQTAMHWCVGLGDAYLPMLRLLIDSGAAVCAKDKAGETPLMRAMEFHNAPAMAAMLDGATRSSLRLDYMDQHGRTHLHWAVLNNYQRHALRFVELGHDVNMEDAEHVVPLYLAVSGCMVPLTDALLKEGDTFLVQNAPFHNGTTVIPDRIKWLDFVSHPSVEDAAAAAAAAAATAAASEPTDGGAADDGNEEGEEPLSDSGMPIEARKQAVIKLLQDKLDDIVASLAAANGGPAKAKKKKRATMALAPSAPVRQRSQSKTRPAAGDKRPSAAK